MLQFVYGSLNVTPAVVAEALTNVGTPMGGTRSYRLVILHGCNTFGTEQQITAWQQSFNTACLVGWHGLTAGSIIRLFEEVFWREIIEGASVALAMDRAWRDDAVQREVDIMDQQPGVNIGWPDIRGNALLPDRRP